MALPNLAGFFRKGETLKAKTGVFMVAPGAAAARKNGGYAILRPEMPHTP